MKVQFNPHGNVTTGVAPPIVDLHDRWLVPPRFVPIDDPDCCMVLKSGQYLDLHEIRDRHWVEWMRGHEDFMVVNRRNHPDAFGG